MDDLPKFINDRLVRKRFCTVFSNEISEHWPCGRTKAQEKRDAAIHDFAERNGLIAEIKDPGIRVIFRKASHAPTLTASAV